MRSLTLFVSVVIAVGIAGCNPTDSAELAADSKKLAATAQRAATNATVAAKVSTALSLRKGVDMGGLKVEAEGGVVTLKGKTRTSKEKALILDIATNTRGVERVVDQLTVP